MSTNIVQPNLVACRERCVCRLTYKYNKNEMIDSVYVVKNKHVRALVTYLYSHNSNKLQHAVRIILSVPTNATGKQ